jgi:hypothetical protein
MAAIPAVRAHHSALRACGTSEQPSVTAASARLGPVCRQLCRPIAYTAAPRPLTDFAPCAGRRAHAPRGCRRALFVRAELPVGQGRRRRRRERCSARACAALPPMPGLGVGAEGGRASLRADCVGCLGDAVMRSAPSLPARMRACPPAACQSIGPPRSRSLSANTCAAPRKRRVSITARKRRVSTHRCGHARRARLLEATVAICACSPRI